MAWSSGLTVCVTGAGADVDSVWEQKKPEARKMLVNRADSPASSARFVGRFSPSQNYCQHSYIASSSCFYLLLVALKKSRNSFETTSGLPLLSAAICPSP